MVIQPAEPMETLLKWESYHRRFKRVRNIRDYYEQLAWSNPDRRRHAEQMRDACNETIYKLTRAMAEIEPHLPVALHQGAEIVNGLALVNGWREW